jgi:hypothetical protein
LKEITAFVCSYCDKLYRRKSSAIRHEKKCYANPLTKACRTCANAVEDSETVYVKPCGDQEYGDADYDVSYLYCSAKDKVISHPDKPCGFEHNCLCYTQGNKLF